MQGENGRGKDEQCRFRFTICFLHNPARYHLDFRKDKEFDCISCVTETLRLTEYRGSYKEPHPKTDGTGNNVRVSFAIFASSPEPSVIGAPSWYQRSWNPCDK
jgi:hypothetical protein